MNGVRLLAVLWIVSSAGCVAPGARQPSATDWAGAVGEFSDWTLQGRLALSNGRDGGSGRLTWQQTPKQADLNFIGALGRGSWRLQVTDEVAELEAAETGLLRASNVETLVRKQLGWEIPFDSMRYWVLGMLDPGRQGSDSYDKRGRLLRLRQAGWLVEYHGWIEVESIWLPRKVTASQDDNRVRILVKKWTVSG